jgi:hypothetical protein
MDIKQELPALYGSEKQIEWAQKVRESVIPDLEDIMDDVQAAAKRQLADGVINQATADYGIRLAEEEIRVLLGVRKASWWIDNRTYPAYYLLSYALRDFGPRRRIDPPADLQPPDMTKSTLGTRAVTLPANDIAVTAIDDIIASMRTMDNA